MDALVLFYNQFVDMVVPWVLPVISYVIVLIVAADMIRDSLKKQ